MKISLTFFILPFVILLSSCTKNADEEEVNNHKRFLQEQIFNGTTQWVVRSMKADTERSFNGQSDTLWSDHFASCRKDNVHQFGVLGDHIASIHIDEGSHSCSLEEPDFISQGLVLDFSNDLQTASVFIKGAAMAKLFDLPYDQQTRHFDFTHSWKFEEVSKEQVVIKALIPADQSAGMAEGPISVDIIFEPHH